jgi:hypothetical protein
MSASRRFSKPGREAIVRRSSIFYRRRIPIFGKPFCSSLSASSTSYGSLPALNNLAIAEIRLRKYSEAIHYLGHAGERPQLNSVQAIAASCQTVAPINCSIIAIRRERDRGRRFVERRVYLRTLSRALEPARFTIAPPPMKDALEFIRQRNLIKIVIDPAVIRIGVDPTMKVALHARSAKLKAVLTDLLKQAPQPLVYKLENGVLTILLAPRTK